MLQRFSFKLLIFVFLLLLGLVGCGKNYQLLHPLKPQPGIFRESKVFDRGQIRVHWVAYYPDREGPLPAVLVLPDLKGVASDMEGICLALARSGYFAAAAHYQRLENLKRRNPLICCRSYEEGTTAYVHLLAQPQVNPERIGLLGFSIGGTHSLLIAASEPGIRAVVAYYPLADAEKWLDHDRQSLVRSLRSRMVQRHLMKELGVSRWEEALPEVRAASPIRHVERIQAPVLLIHGEKDRTVPVGQSEDLYQEFQSRGKSCQLLILPRAGHTFNFRDEERAKIAWEKTLQFLDVCLRDEHPLPASGS